MAKQKDMGTRWEREAVKLLNKNFPKTWRRIPSSGALGTNLEIPSLKSDIVGGYYFLEKQFAGEAKYGYGTTQMAVKKEWFDKIKATAEESYSLPVVVLKFRGARSGVKHVIATDFDTWDTLLSEVEALHKELLRLYEELDEYEKREQRTT